MNKKKPELTKAQRWDKIIKIPKWLPPWYVLYAPSWLVPSRWLVGIIKERTRWVMENVELDTSKIRIRKRKK
jgi:hypothetical protein